MKTFTSTRQKREPVPFTISYEYDVTEKVEVPGPDGQPTYEERDTGQTERRERVFHARPGTLNAGMTIAINDLDPSDPMAGIRQTQAIKDAIRVGIVEHEDFWLLLSDPRAQIEPDVLSGVLSWLVELTSARPTRPPRR